MASRREAFSDNTSSIATLSSITHFLFGEFFLFTCYTCVCDCKDDRSQISMCGDVTSDRHFVKSSVFLLSPGDCEPGRQATVRRPAEEEELQQADASSQEPRSQLDSENQS